jgi:FkbM family methyltransferase
LLARSGVTDGARIVLRELGLSTPESVVYPGLERRFVVEFDPVWRWIGKGIREPGVLRFTKDRIGSGSTVIDVGAHVGEWTILFSELVGKSGRVISFEPDPVARASLRKNLEMNGISNVTVEEKSVGDKTGRALLAAERFGSGLSSIVRTHGHDSRYDVIEVAATTLDQYCEGQGITPDWIKIDAEGAEAMILRGMQRLIKTVHPSVILEFHFDGLAADEKREAWSAVTEKAASVQFLQSRRRDLLYLETLSKEDISECGFLIVYVKY